MSSGEVTQDKITQLLNVDTAEDENVKSLVGELTNSKNIETKTAITRQQVVVISRAIWYAKRYGNKPLDIYTRKVMLKLNVSIDRGGRSDLTTALTGVFGFALNRQKNDSVKV
jgi:hypothetical protein